MLKLKLTLTTLTLTLVTNVFGFSAWNSKNKPELFEDNYERSFAKLDLKGQLSKRPWSGNYWATHTGGINFRWNKKLKVAEEHERFSYDIPNYDDLSSAGVPVKFMSPAEKYDIFIGKKSFDLVKYERSRTKVMKTVEGSEEHDKSFEIPSWEGLCHAWAPATLAYDNIGPVTLKNIDGIEVQFGSSDVKALLTYHLHMNRAPKTKFLGSRCRLDFKELKEKLEKGEITQADYDSQINSAECADTNAGAFHIVLTNQIADMDQGFVVDITRDAEVWNQAVYSYETRELSRKSGASEGAAPGTVEEVTVETKLTYIVEVYQRWDSEITPASLRTDTFKYRLELNNKGNIIGGEWETEDRPDFIWKSTPAKFQGYFAKLGEIYDAAVLSAQKEEAKKETLKQKMQERDKLRTQSERQENASINSDEQSELSSSSDRSLTKLKYAALHLDRSAKHFQNQLAHDLDPELTEVEMSAKEIAAIDSVIEITALTAKLKNHLSSRSASRNTAISILNEMIGKINAGSSALNAIEMTSHQIADYNHFIGMVNRVIKVVRGESVSTTTSPSQGAHHTDSVHFDTETTTPDVAEEERRREEEARAEEERRREEERIAEEERRAEDERIAEEERRAEEARAEEDRRREEAARAEEERRREEARAEEERRRNELNLSGLSPAKKITQISSRMSSVLSQIARNVQTASRRSRAGREALNNLRLLQSGISRLKSNRDLRTMKSQAEAIDFTLEKFSKSIKRLSLRGNTKVQIKDLKSLSSKMVKVSRELPQGNYRRPNRRPNRRPGRRYGPGRRM